MKTPAEALAELEETLEEISNLQSETLAHLDLIAHETSQSESEFQRANEEAEAATTES